MENLALILILMTTTAAFSQKASTIRNTFSRETTVSINIEADASIVWTLLTNAADFPRWNSTIVYMEGEIELGEKIELKSTLDEKRTFKLKVKEFDPEKRMVWGDGKGKRVYTITKNENGLTFTMTEKIGGLMFPMYAKYIPSFDESFEQFAADLKKESETISKAN